MKKTIQILLASLAGSLLSCLPAAASYQGNIADEERAGVTSLQEEGSEDHLWQDGIGALAGKDCDSQFRFYYQSDMRAGQWHYESAIYVLNKNGEFWQLAPEKKKRGDNIAKYDTGYVCEDDRAARAGV